MTETSETDIRKYDPKDYGAADMISVDKAKIEKLLVEKGMTKKALIDELPCKERTFYRYLHDGRMPHSLGMQVAQTLGSSLLCISPDGSISLTQALPLLFGSKPSESETDIRIKVESPISASEKETKKLARDLSQQLYESEDKMSKDKKTNRELTFETHCASVNRYWGNATPMLAMEEAGEFIQALSKMERVHIDGNIDEDEARKMVIDEIGDLLISLEAVRQHYKIRKKDIRKRLDYKRCKAYSIKKTTKTVKLPKKGDRS